jgi:cell division protein FtsL
LGAYPNESSNATRRRSQESLMPLRKFISKLSLESLLFFLLHSLPSVFLHRDLDKQMQNIKELTLTYDDEEDDNNSVSHSSMKTTSTDKLIDTAKRDPLTGSLLASEKAKLYELIDRWEEPDRQSAKLVSAQMEKSAKLLSVANSY